MKLKQMPEKLIYLKCFIMKFAYIKKTKMCWIKKTVFTKETFSHEQSYH